MPLYEIPVRLPNGTEATRKMNAETVEDAVTALTEIGFEVIASGTPEPQKVEPPEPEKVEPPEPEKVEPPEPEKVEPPEPEKVEDKPKRAKKD